MCRERSRPPPTSRTRTSTAPACTSRSPAKVDDGVDDRTATHVALWEAGQRAAIAAGASVSHHHGIGLARGRYVADAMGPAFAVFEALKQALDPNGILNPGKLGLASPWGDVAWW